MKRLVYIVMVIVLFLAGCVSATEQPTTVIMGTDTATPPPTSTKTLLSTATKRPSATPAIPTATITPMSLAPTSVSPLALNEFNAATEMKRLNVIGTGAAHDIQFSPNGKLFAVATGRGIYLYDGTTFEQSDFIDVNDTVSAIAFSPDGSVLAVAVDGKVSLWNVVSGQNMYSLDGSLIGISKLAYGKGGRIAALGGDCRGCGSPQLAMILWDAKTGRQIYLERDIWYFTDALAFTPDGRQLLYGGAAGLTILDADSGKLASAEENMTVRFSSPYNMLLNNDGTRLFVTSNEAPGQMFDLTARTPMQFSFCDVYLTGIQDTGACFKGQNIVILDLVTGKEIKSIPVEFSPLSYENILFAISPDGQFLVYEEGDNLRLVNVQDGSLIRELNFPNFYTVGAGLITLDEVERHLVIIEYPAGQISLIDLQSGETLRIFKMECCEITGFAIAPDHKTVATMGDHVLQLWDVSTQQVLYEEKFRSDLSGAIAFSKDGSKVFLINDISKSYIVLYDLQTRESIEVEGFSYQYNYDFLAPDNYHFNGIDHPVVWQVEDQLLLFIDSITQEEMNVPLNSDSDFDIPETFAFSPDGKYLTLGTYNGISVWDISTRKFIATLSGHEPRGGDGWAGAIKSLSFSPQSNLLVSVGWDGTVRLWNIITGNEIRRLNVCCSASFTPDGRYLVTASDGVIRIWGIP